MNELLSVYLPVAGISINVLLLIAIGLSTGIVSGIFGFGGGIFLLPMLSYIAIPAQVAVAVSTNQMTALSVSGYLAHARRKRVDYKLAFLMLTGGIIGSGIGVLICNYLRSIGLLDITISTSFMLLLITVCYFTAKDALTILYLKMKPSEIKKERRKMWYHNFELPFRIQFISSRYKISLIMPILVGSVGGFLVSMLGIGGGLVMLPAMIYILKISEVYTSGTAYLQIIFTSILSTIFHSLDASNIDIILSSILIIGTVFGTQIGVKISTKFHPDNYRLILAAFIFILALVVVYGLVMEPKSLYDIERL